MTTFISDTTFDSATNSWTNLNPAQGDGFENSNGAEISTISLNQVARNLLPRIAYSLTFLVRTDVNSSTNCLLKVSFSSATTKAPSGELVEEFRLVNDCMN